MKRVTSRTFISVNKDYLEHVKKYVEETTYIGYVTCANRINRLIGNERVASMTSYQLFVFINETMCHASHSNGKVGYSKKTRKNTASYLCLLYEFIFGKELLRNNPCNGGLKVKGENDRRLVKVYSQHAINTLRQSSTYLSLAALFCMHTGLRPSEVVALTYSNVSKNQDGEIHLAIDKASPLKALKSTKNKFSRRNVILSGTCIDLLTSLLDENGVRLETVIGSNSTDTFLLINPKMKTRFIGSKKLYLQLKKEFERLKLDYHGVQPCRHTFVTRCAGVGMPFEEIADYLGHSSTQMVKAIYSDREQLVIGRQSLQYLNSL